MTGKFKGQTRRLSLSPSLGLSSHCMLTLFPGKLSVLAGMLALATLGTHDMRRVNYSLPYKLLKIPGKDTYLLSLDSISNFRPVTTLWEIKYYNWCRSRGQRKGVMMVLAKFTRVPWRGEGSPKESVLGEEIRSCLKAYVWFFRLYYRRWQRLYVADLMGNAALPHQT